LKPEVLDKLRVRLKEPPDDGGLWTSVKVAAFLARELGLEGVAVQRGWEALKACGMSIQTPRRKIPSPPRRRRRWRLKKPRRHRRRGSEQHPERPVEVFASDEHRLGLKPVTRRVWAPVGERPIAPGHHRFDWLYVTAFVSPASGETFWYVHDGVSKPFFSACSKPLRARPAPALAEPSCSFSTTRAGMAKRGSMSQTACGWFSCRPTRQNCNQPNVVGASRRAHRQQTCRDHRRT